MKKRLSILTLLGVFFLSTTGLPLTISFCNMGDFHNQTRCKMHMEKMSDHSCCNRDKSDNPVKLTELNPGSCCEFKIVDNNVTDKFLSASNESGSRINVNKATVSVSTVFVNQYFSSPAFISNNSPPTSLNTQIYLVNSILLI